MKLSRLLLVLWLGAASSLHADDPLPELTSLSVSNGQKKIEFNLFPTAERYKFLKTDQLTLPFAEDSSGIIDGSVWTAPVAGPIGFHRLEVVPMDRNLLLTTTLLNRLGY